MFNIVPSNRQEYLLEVLIALLKQDYQSGNLGVFEPSTIMVESLGMKHYVNMGIAQQCSVSMNIDFPLVSRCIYSLCRKILGENQVPKESLFKREIMVWRIDSILASESFIDHPDAKAANEYWQSAIDVNKARFLLAQNTADVFEQYMQFRPTWFDKWQANESVLSKTEKDSDDNSQQLLEPWQRRIWQFILNDDASLAAHGDMTEAPVDSASKSPAKIIERATQQFQVDKYDLPKVIYIFAVNALTPQQLVFLKTISEQVDIFLFHLNPCVEYWGDLVSEKALMHQKLKQGMVHLLDEESPNLLLANLGKQGRVLFNQLQDIEYPDFTNKQLFINATESEQASNSSLLKALQQDLLLATTGHYSEDKQGTPPADNSISIHGCHSALREIQVLHDQLLHIIENDIEQDIQAHDIIVLCPAIEDYAPFVKSVFRGPYDQETNDEPRLVCSIADRAPLDAEPMISMFMDMLSLPDSRFSATSLIDYLHIESVQKKFNLSAAEVSLCEQWIADANIYWGKDSEHKSTLVKVENSEETYTWEWGLSRLLKSALYPSKAYLDEQYSLNFAALENVEGLQMRTLGKLVLFIEKLQDIFNSLALKRSMQDWLSYVNSDIVEVIFDNRSDDNVLQTLKRVLEQLSANVNKAHHNNKVPIKVLHAALTSTLSSPDPINQFNTGQVTFSSMVPMRSVPFKVVCMLGLNDGVFPRSSQPISINLMNNEPKLASDRSRRNEDRYMFLEALISARKYLYLSYQSKISKNNASREPSLVLREFMTYIKRAFNLELLTHHPLQAFSPKVFDAAKLANEQYADRPSFAQSWLAVNNTEAPLKQALEVEFKLPNLLTAQELSSAFNDPLASFCHKHLQLSFEKFMDSQGDIEPFDVSSLTNFDLSSAMLESASQGSKTQFEKHLEQMLASGELPQSSEFKTQYLATYELLAPQVNIQVDSSNYEHREFKCALSVPINGVAQKVIMYTNMLTDDNNNTHQYLMRMPKNQLLLKFCIEHAIKRIALESSTQSCVSSTLEYANTKAFLKEAKAYRNGKNESVPELEQDSLCLSDENFPLSHCRAFLVSACQAFHQLMSTPTPIYTEVAVAANNALNRAEQRETDEPTQAQNYSDIEQIDELFSKSLQQNYLNNEYQAYLFADGIDWSLIDLELMKNTFFTYLPRNWELSF